MTLRRGLIAAAGNYKSPISVDAVTFDGSNDYTTRGADLTGAANGKLGIASFWINTNTIAAQVIYRGTNQLMRILLLNDNTIQVRGQNAAVSTILQMASTTVLSTGKWHHVLASWDLANTVGHLYCDGQEDQAGGSTLTDDTIDYTDTDHAIGASPAGGTKLNGDLAEVYINLAEYIDLSVQANRQKFRVQHHFPANVGAAGATPTGTAPIMYFKASSGTPANFANNLGGGGNFSVTGTLTNASSSPSD
ncbi:hypothetical protein LCGC14_0389630 [marine sediment metagenome]|uniref:LamG-like jellyroll fold domain-containing protein n=1 Tax=marine sediment metagenome TaxID=412755 RepID=A0A0F9VM28_9ZZZZ